MRSFDPSQYGEPGTVLDIDPPRWKRGRDIVRPERREGEWQPIGDIVQRVMARLTVELDDQP